MESTNNKIEEKKVEQELRISKYLQNLFILYINSSRDMLILESTAVSIFIVTSVELTNIC